MDPFSSASPIFSAAEELPFNGELPLSVLSPDPLFDPLTTVSSPLSDASSRSALSAFSNYIKPARDVGSSVQDDDHGGHIQQWKREQNREKNDRDFQHMMRERLRRERLSKSYADLHSMLPLGTKACKAPILKSTAMMVRELKIVEQEKQRRNHELLSMLKLTPTIERSSEPSDEIKIKIKLPNTMSTVDSMINALHCLKEMDVKIRAIRSELGELELIMTT